MLSIISASIPALRNLAFSITFLCAFSLRSKVFNAFRHFRQHPHINKHCFSIVFFGTLNDYKGFQCFPTFPPRINKPCFSIVSFGTLNGLKGFQCFPTFPPRIKIFYYSIIFRCIFYGFKGVQCFLICASIPALITLVFLIVFR